MSWWAAGSQDMTHDLFEKSGPMDFGAGQIYTNMGKFPKLGAQNHRFSFQLLNHFQFANLGFFLGSSF